MLNLTFRHVSVPWILVAYSDNAAAFLEKGFPKAPGRLGLVVCRRLPWKGTLINPGDFLDGSAVTPGKSDRDTALALGRVMTHGTHPGKEGVSNAIVATGGVRGDSAGMLNDQTIRITTPRNKSQTEETGDASIYMQKDLSTRKNGGTFEEKYGITYEYLTRIPASVKSTGSGMGKFDHHRARFFLAFGEDKQEEEAELTAWLSTRTEPHMVCSALEAHSWKRYKEAVCFPFRILSLHWCAVAHLLPGFYV